MGPVDLSTLRQTVVHGICRPRGMNRTHGLPYMHAMVSMRYTDQLVGGGVNFLHYFVIIESGGELQQICDITLVS